MRESAITTDSLDEMARFHRKLANNEIGPKRTELFCRTQNAWASICEELADRRREDALLAVAQKAVDNPTA
jgi:hypothetical protein